MCIEVRVTYERCFHVHLGYELCAAVEPDRSCCSKFETNPRIDPFCPLCSKLEYRAYRLQPDSGIKAQTVSAALIQPGTIVHPGHRQSLGQLPLQARHDSGVGKQKAANNAKRLPLESQVSDSPLSSPIHSPNKHIPPPLPIEPPIDFRLLGPHQFLEHRQRLAMVVADARPRLGPRDWCRS